MVRWGRTKKAVPAAGGKAPPAAGTALTIKSGNKKRQTGRARLPGGEAAPQLGKAAGLVKRERERERERESKLYTKHVTISVYLKTQVGKTASFL
jgi:hypothetical protein